MSSLQRHGASHMAPYMPEGMQDTGTAMHRSASRFALAELTQQCTACHAGYRLL